MQMNQVGPQVTKSNNFMEHVLAHPNWQFDTITFKECESAKLYDSPVYSPNWITSTCTWPDGTIVSSAHTEHVHHESLLSGRCICGVTETEKDEIDWNLLGMLACSTSEKHKIMTFGPSNPNDLLCFRCSWTPHSNIKNWMYSFNPFSDIQDVITHEIGVHVLKENVPEIEFLHQHDGEKSPTHKNKSRSAYHFKDGYQPRMAWWLGEEGPCSVSARNITLNFTMKKYTVDGPVKNVLFPDCAYWECDLVFATESSAKKLGSLCFEYSKEDGKYMYSSTGSSEVSSG